MSYKIQGGKGWGDGSMVQAFNENRMTNPANTYTGFRPRVENEGCYYVIRNWCKDPRVRKSFSSLINSLLPYISVAVQHTTERDEDGRITIELNLGRIEIV